MIENNLECIDFSSLRSDADPARLRELWKIYREYIVHEDDLINQRLQRLLVVQGFLLAAFGACVTEWGKSFGELTWFLANPAARLGSIWRYESAVPLCYGVFALLLTVLGILSARASRRAIKAAQMAREKLMKDWITIAAQRSAELGLPGFGGGGSVKAFKKGEKNLKELPGFFVIFWAVIAGGVVFFFLAVLCFILSRK